VSGKVVYVKNFQAMYPFEGYVTRSVTFEGGVIHLELARDGRRALRCPGCGHPMAKNRERRRTCYDLSGGTGTVAAVSYPSIQGYCCRCGTYPMDRPAEVHPTRQATWRFMRFVSMLARFVPMDAMAGFCGVPAATAWRFDMDVLKNDLPEPNLDGIRAINVDEKSVRRGHAYVTLVLNADTGELLHMVEGKKKSSLESFFERLTPAQKGSIEAVCIDRAGAYKSAVAEHLPNAAIVYDRFHLMANLGKAIDQVRREEYHDASDADKAVIKGQRYNLLRNPENLKEDGKQSLGKLLAINENLSIAHLLKDQFRLTWTYGSAAWARKHLLGWIGLAEAAAIEPLTKFANGVGKDIEGIVAWCKHRITNGLIEGFNSIVSKVIFKARGIRSLTYLHLKLRQESLLQL
jgi:transposase